MNYSSVTHILEMMKQDSSFDFQQWLMTTDTQKLMWR